MPAPGTTTRPQGRTDVRRDSLFFSGMSLAVAAIVFAGFAQTYYLSPWLDPPARMPPMTALLHIHAAAFTLWILLTIVQPLLIAGRMRQFHRRLGWVAAGVAGTVWLLGNLVSVQAMTIGYRAMGDPFAFYAITFFSMQAFGLIVAIAILKRRDAAAHKRLMLLSSAAILEAAFARIPLALIETTAPISFYVGSECIILAGVIHDLAAAGGRVHWVWRWGGTALIASQLLRLAVMDSAAWLSFAHFISIAYVNIVHM